MRVVFVFLALIISGCGNMGIHNPYEQSVSEALAPDMFDMNIKRNNLTDQAVGTDFRLRWKLE